MKDSKKVELPKEFGEEVPAGTPPKFIPWTEASLEQKVERCHVVTREVSEILATVQKRMDKMEKNFWGHKHVGDTLMALMNQFSDSFVEEEKKDEKPDSQRWF